MNNVCLSGYLCADPELKQANGKSYVSVSIAVNRPKNQDGTRIADFIECVFWNSRAEAISKYCKKGYRLGVTGSLRTSKYQKQDGSFVHKMVVYVSSIDFQESKPKTETQAVSQTSTQSEPQIDPFEDFSNEIVITDDMLPFGD